MLCLSMYHPFLEILQEKGEEEVQVPKFQKGQISSEKNKEGKAGRYTSLALPLWGGPPSPVTVRRCAKDHDYALHMRTWPLYGRLFAGFTQVSSPIVRLMGSFIPLLQLCFTVSDSCQSTCSPHIPVAWSLTRSLTIFVLNLVNEMIPLNLSPLTFGSSFNQLIFTENKLYAQHHFCCQK